MAAPVISQTQTTHVWDDPTLPQFSATASAPIAWTAPRGVFSPTTTASGAPTTFTPPNGQGNIVITARNTGDNLVSTTIIAIEAVFPYQPSWKAAGRALDVKTNMSIAEDNSQSFTEKGGLFRVYRYGFNGPTRSHAEFVIVEDFFGWHKRSRWFWLKDVPRALTTIVVPKRIKVRFDSELLDDPEGLNGIPYSFVAREAVGE